MEIWCGVLVISKELLFRVYDIQCRNETDRHGRTSILLVFIYWNARGVRVKYIICISSHFDRLCLDVHYTILRNNPTRLHIHISEVHSGFIPFMLQNITQSVLAEIHVKLDEKDQGKVRLVQREGSGHGHGICCR
jgi:hypothetical protein